MKHSLITLTLLSIVTTGCLSLLKSDGKMRKTFSFESVVFKPSASGACAGQEVEVEMSGKILSCPENPSVFGDGCKHVSTFSTVPGAAHEHTPCSQFRAYPHIFLVKNNDDQSASYYDQEAFDSATCTLKLKQPVSQTYYDGQNHVPFKSAQILFGQSAIGADSQTKSPVGSIRCN